MNRLKRLLKHRWVNEATAQQLLPADLLQRLEQRVRASEKRHSGEIRLFIETSLPLRYLYEKTPTPALIHKRALEVFSQLRVWDTAHNNGVLIYLLVVEHAIEIVGDRGLHSGMDAKAWGRLVSDMSKAFRQGDYEGGLTNALEEVSAVLVQNFPLRDDETNPNELPDAPIIN